LAFLLSPKFQKKGESGGARIRYVQKGAIEKGGDKPLISTLKNAPQSIWLFRRVLLVLAVCPEKPYRRV